MDYHEKRKCKEAKKKQKKYIVVPTVPPFKTNTQIRPESGIEENSTTNNAALEIPCKAPFQHYK